MKSANAIRVLWILLMVGCGPAQFSSQLPDSFVLGAGQTIEFLPIENGTGQTLDPPADQIFNEYMAELLKEKNLLNVSSGPGAFVLKTQLTEFAAGSAVGRWIFPGIGTTVCAVKAEIHDKKTGKLVGHMQSRQTVSAGGFYSIGADHYICKPVADDLMREIDKKIKLPGNG